MLTVIRLFMTHLSMYTAVCTSIVHTQRDTHSDNWDKRRYLKTKGDIHVQVKGREHRIEPRKTVQKQKCVT